MPLTGRDARRDAAFWAVAAASTAAAAVWLTRHMSLLQWDNDEGLFAMVGLAVADGHRLYADAWIDHPPGTSHLLAAAFEAFGATLPVARGATLALTLPGLLGVAALARRLGGRTAGLAAIPLVVLAPHFFWLSRSINQDLPSMALGVCAVAAVWRAADGGRRAWLALGGLVLGLGLSLKLSPVVCAAPLACLLGVRAYRSAAAGGWAVTAPPARAGLARDAIAAAVPLAAVVGAWFLTGPPAKVAYGVFGTIAAARDAFPDRSAEYADWLVRENLLGENLGLTLLAAAGLAWLARRRPADAAVMTAWCAATGWSLVTQRPMWPKHHWSLVLWPLGILAGVGLAAAARAAIGGWRLPWRRRGGEGGGGPARARRAAGMAAGTAVVAAWLATVPGTAARLGDLVAPKQFGAMAYGAQWLAANTAPDAQVVSDSGMVAFLAGRRIPPWVAVVSSKRIRIGDLTGTDLVAAAELPSVAAVLLWNDQLQDFPDFMAWLPTRFVRAERVGDDREIWRRFDPAVIGTRQPATFYEVATLEGFTLAGGAADTATAGALPGARALAGATGGAAAGSTVETTAVRAGEAVTLTLYWRAAGATPADLTVFVHVDGPAGRTVAQADGPPAAGEWPSSAWVPGQIVVDRRAVAIPPDAPPDTYRVRVGLYDAATSTRVGAGRPDGTLWPDGAVVLAARIAIEASGLPSR